MKTDYSLGVEWPTVTAVDKNGTKKRCDTLMTFESAETGKSYIVYTDYSIDEAGNLQLYASTYDQKSLNQDLVMLTMIEDESEMAIVSNAIDTLKKDITEDPVGFLKMIC